ncbi:MAG: ammonia-forming cytochrome c nitrite reductase subunit c552 [Brooklawnia sp.]|uniref:ammonia-forming cytochrome c nitrite reductase subunit c552 n=1 Tax=Brooklawnia sp. TaxID=2699740 RepID=UPI003C74E448
MSTSNSQNTDTTWTGPRKRWVPIVVLIAVAIAAAGLTWLLTTIFAHRQEATQPFTQVVEITETTYDPAVWGQNFPLQYEGFKATAEMAEEDKVPNDPPNTENDQRGDFITHSKLAMEPRLVTIWRGYAFSVEYREPRGHEYMLVDQQWTHRQTNFNQSGACLNCHASLPEIVNNLGDGDQAAGWAEMNKLPYGEAVQHAAGPIACIDCHEPETMALRITRPAFVEGIRNFKASQGIENYDVNTDATNQEMRAYVCAQCHVEYYFKGEEKTLTFPWHEGLTVNDAIAYFDGVGFSDFVHADTQASVIKAQHPDFETYSQGIHAANGVTCADCHMSYQRTGAAKISDHQIASPMRSEETINQSCLTCHHSTAEEMNQRVDDIQARWHDAKNVSFTAVQALIDDIVAAMDEGTVTEDQLAAARDFQRKAQYIVDYTVSENSYGFHAPAYSIAILNQATDYARSGQLVLRGIDVENARGPETYDIPPVEPPA